MSATLAPPEPAVKGNASDTRPAAKKDRHLNYNVDIGAVFMTVGAEEFNYWLDPLGHELGGQFRCYRMTKFLTTRKEGEPNHYDVKVDLSGRGEHSCECRGWLRWHHCKHVSSALALHQRGKLS